MDSEKSKKYFAAVVLLVVVAAALLIFNPFKPAKPAPTRETPQIGIATPSLEANLNPNVAIDFEEETIENDGAALTQGHSLEISETDRTETFALTNDGDEDVSFTLIQITPSSIKEKAYTENENVYSFADASPSPKASAKKGVVESSKKSLKPGQTLAVKVKSSETKELGILFVPVLSKKVDLTEFKALLEEKVADDSIKIMELSPQEAETLSHEIQAIVNDDTKYPNWSDKKLALTELLSKVQTTIVSGNANAFFSSVATELQPGAFVEIPLFGASKQQTKDLLLRVEGDLSKFVASGYPKVVEEDGIVKIKTFFDFRKGASFKGGLLSDKKGSALTEITGTLSFAQVKQPDKKTLLPLSVRFEHVQANDFVVLSPQTTDIYRVKDTSVRKPVFAVNNLPFEIKLDDCGFKKKILEQGEASAALVGFENSDCSVSVNDFATQWITVSGFKEKTNSVKESEAAEDVIADAYYSSSAVPYFNWRSCSEVYCGCDALNDNLVLLKQRFEDDLRQIPDVAAYKELFGSTKYARTAVLLATSLENCDLETPFQGKIKEGKINVAKLSADIAKDPLQFSVQATSLQSQEEGLKEINNQWLYATEDGVRSDDTEKNWNTIDQRCVPFAEVEGC